MSAAASLDPLTGVLLFAHGSRDPRWASPFERIADRVKALHKGPVSLAFLEFMAPTIELAYRDLCAQGAQQVRVVPLFLSAGHHLREDLPRLVDALNEFNPACPVTLAAPMGDDAALLSAIADWVVTTS